MPKDVVSVRLSSETLARVQHLAREREWSQSHWMARAIERAVEAEERERGSDGRAAPKS